MAAGVSLGIFSDTQEFERGIRSGVIDPLEDTATAVADLNNVAAPSIGADLAADVSAGVTKATGSLESLETAVEGVQPTADVGDAIATDVDQGVDKAKTDLERLETKMREYRTTAKTQSNLAGNDIGTSVHEGARKAGEGIDGMKEASSGGLREIAGSFDGTMQGVAGGVQGVLAEIGEGFGPLGAIVGAGLGIALGGVMSQLEGTQEQSAAAKERVTELTAEFLASGTVGRRSFSGVVDAVTALATATGPDELNLSDLWTQATAAGVNYQELITALASGSAGDIEAVRAKVAELGEEHYKEATAAKTGRRTTASAEAAALDATGKLKDELTAAGTAAKLAAERQRLAARAGLTEFALKNDLIEQLHDDYTEASGAVDEYISDESGLFNVEKYITAMTERQEALRNYQETLATSNLSPAAKAHIESLGVEQAAAMLVGYKKATPAQQKALNGIWSTAGDKAADSYGTALGTQLQGKTVKGPKIGKSVVPTPDSAAFRRALNTLDNKEIAIRVKPKLPRTMDWW